MDRKDVLMDVETASNNMMDEPLSKPDFLLSSVDPLESKIPLTRLDKNFNDLQPTSLDESVKETLKRDLHTIYTKLKYFYSFNKSKVTTNIFFLCDRLKSFSIQIIS